MHFKMSNTESTLILMVNKLQNNKSIKNSLSQNTKTHSLMILSTEIPKNQLIIGTPVNHESKMSFIKT